VLMRTPLGLDVLRDRNALYRETRGGLVENVYTLKIINMDEREHAYRLEIAGLPGAELVLDHDEVRVPAGEVVSLAARVQIDPYDLKHASSKLTFVLAAVDDPELSAHEEARFLGPVPAR
jgi:polyferredoxin